MRSYPVEELVSSLQKSLSDEMERYTLLESKYYDLKKQLDEAVKVIEFYGEKSHWGIDKPGMMTSIDPCDQEHNRGGKTAIEFLQKMKEKV